MISITEVEPDLFQIDYREKTLKTLLNGDDTIRLLLEGGIEQTEVEAAFIEMIRKSHNSAEFGFNGSFVVSTHVNTSSWV